jgi:hypothetical protein
MNDIPKEGSHQCTTKSYYADWDQLTLELVVIKLLIVLMLLHRVTQKYCKLALARMANAAQGWRVDLQFGKRKLGL